MTFLLTSSDPAILVAAGSHNARLLVDTRALTHLASIGNWAAPPLLWNVIIIVIFAVTGLAYWFLVRRSPQVADELHIAQRADDPNEIVDIPKLQPKELWFGASEDERDIEFYPMKGSALLEKKYQLNPSNTGLSRLGQSLQGAVSIFSSALIGSGDYVRVIVHGPLAPASDSRYLLPFVRGTDGKICELAKLVKSDQLRQIVGAAALWQAASIIVAQKHLADISKKLDEIRKGIDEIRSFLETERKTRMIVAITYLRDKHDAIMRGDLPHSAVRNELETVSRELRGIELHLRAELQACIDGISSIKHSDIIGTEEFTQNIEKHQDVLRGIQSQLILCLSARAATWQVWSAFAGEEHGKEVEKESILNAIEDFEKLRLELDNKMGLKIDQVRSLINSYLSKNLDGQRQDRLRERQLLYQAEIASSTRRLHEQIVAGADRLIAYAKKPLELVLKVEGGKVLKAYEI